MRTEEGSTCLLTGNWAVIRPLNHLPITISFIKEYNMEEEDIKEED